MKKAQTILLAILLLCGCTSNESNNSSRLKLWYNQPAQAWNDAMPLANGRLAAMVRGDVNQEVITLNEETLWSGFPEDCNNPEAIDFLPRVREAIFNGEYEKADELCLHMQGCKCTPYAPMANLIFKYETGDSLKDYYRELDISKAVAHVRYETEKGEFNREILISFPDQVLLMKLTSKHRGQLTFKVCLSSLLNHHIQSDGDGTMILKGKCPKIANVLRFPGNPVQYEDMDGEGMNFDARLTVDARDGEVTLQDSFINVSNATEVDIYFSAGTSFNGFDKSPGLEGKNPESVTIPYLEKAIQKGYEKIKKDHIHDYTSFFNRVSLDLNGPDQTHIPTNELLKLYKTSAPSLQLEELLFHYGRYLFISCSREGGVPIHLQGKWSDRVLPPWNDNYTTNINLQMSYWPGNQTNLAELNQPLFQQIKNMSINGAKTASINYGCRGWCAHHNSDIWAMTYPAGEYGKFGVRSIKWMHFPLAGAWLCQHLFDHYLFTQDESFLRKEAYPLMKGAAIFLQDWLIESPEGELVTCPSVSPELSFITHDGQSASADYASTVDIAIARELFNNCIQSAEILDIDPSFRDTLETLVLKLPAYKTGDRGQLQEWYHDWKEAQVTHRHLSHLYGLHPGNQISPLTTPQLAEASRRSLELRGDEAVGWSLAWKVCMWARLHDGDRAHKLIENVFTYVEPDETKEGFRKPGTYPNLLGSCPPLILDSNFGYVAGVTEMLLQSHLGEVHLLPALPGIWSGGKISGLCARGGYVVDISWLDGELTDAVIYPLKTGACTIRYKDSVKQINVKAEVPYMVSIKDFQL